MAATIEIAKEENSRSMWIKVFVPANAAKQTKATIQDKQGAVLKRLTLSEGQNSIDISSVKEYPISIKVETPFETILKEIKPTGK